MKIENLRTLIRESIQEYIKEIDEAAETAAMEARIAKCDEAIATREAKLGAISESDHKDLMDEGKIKGLENEIKELKKAKAKFEKLQEKRANKLAGKKDKKEVVADAKTEDAPVDEADVMAEMDVTDEAVEETSINESFLKMQKLAGVITESQYNQRKSLIENQIEEGAVIDTALGVAGGLVGLWALLKGGAVVVGMLGNSAINMVDRMADKAKAAAMKAKKEGRLDTIKPIISKFENDEELKNMYQNLTPKDNGTSAKAGENNALRAKQLQAIAKYIKSKLTPEEMEYFTDVSSMLRTGDIA